MRPVAAVAVLAAAAGSASACGSERLPPPPASSPQRVALEITLDRDGEGARSPRTVKLECPSAGREEACARVRRLPPAAFAPVPRDAVCTEIYGGPQRGGIEGAVGRRRVDATYSRANGCEIARYDRVRFLLDLAR